MTWRMRESVEVFNFVPWVKGFGRCGWFGEGLGQVFVTACERPSVSSGCRKSRRLSGAAVFNQVVCGCSAEWLWRCSSCHIALCCKSCAT